MKNLLYFLLGFFLVFYLGLTSLRADGCIPDTGTSAGYCTVIHVYKYQSNIPKTDYASTLVTDITNCWPVSVVRGTNNTITYPASRYYLHIWRWNGSSWQMLLERLWYIQDRDFDDFLSKVVAAGGYYSNTENFPPDLKYPTGIPGCGQPSLDCTDSDSDGVCDDCDASPDDSNAGLDTYMKGYYVYNNKTVGFISSDSPSSESRYDSVTVLDFSAPGVIIGAGGGIDTDTFIENGGRFVALDKPEFIYRTTCQKVTDLSQCATTPCLYDTTAPSDDLNLDPENTPPENTTRPTIEEQKDELPYLNPNRTCDQRKYQCSNLCGGTEQIAGFACQEDGYYACECKNGGASTLVENYGDTINTQVIDNSSEQIENQGSQTGNNINIGGDYSGGGTSIDTDSDGFADGYVAGERMIDFAPLVRSTSLLQTKFPFSLVSYVADLIEPWIKTPTAPVFTFNLFGGHFEFDMARLDPLADFIRSMLGFFFTALCVWGIITIFF